MKVGDAFPLFMLPGIRFGAYAPPYYTTGQIHAYPQPTDRTDSETNDGAWLFPDRRFCNPLGWKVLSKGGIGHSGWQNNNQYLSSGVVLTKLVVCLKANCTSNKASCAPMKCYVHKKGKCLKFNKEIFPRYISQHTSQHSEEACKLLESGAYTDCDETAQFSSQSVIAGN
jgi:hypothetical protein